MYANPLTILPRQVPICLVGNKIDLHDERKVTTTQGEQKQREWRERKTSRIDEVQFMETSAMTNVNVTEMFKGLAKVMIKDGLYEQAQSTKTGGPERAPLRGDSGGGCKCTIQ